MDKFAGIGLKNIFLIWIVCVIFSVIAKVLLTKYPVEGLTQVMMVGA